MIAWLENWYQEQCDGDWEHENGITIETIDNPGWLVKIDLSSTRYAKLKMPYTLTENSVTDWIGYSIEDAVFKAAGGPQKLSDIIALFKHICEINESK